MKIYIKGKNLRFFVVAICYIGVSACNKLVEIDPPTNTIVTAQVYSDDANANSAINGLYSKLFSKTTSSNFGNSWITFYCGLSADELIPYLFDNSKDEFYKNKLLPQNGALYPVWSQAYSVIYQTNASISALTESVGVSVNAKSQFISESKFIRAFCYFYLVNLFGDVPLVSSIEWKENAAVPRTKSGDILKFVVSDLLEAEKYLKSDFSISRNERVRATKWSVYSLLAKVYALMGDWSKAELYTNMVIQNSTLFKLANTPDDAFIKNSKETILQWHSSNQIYPFNSLPEGTLFVPRNNSWYPNVYLTNSLLKAFDSADLRLKQWIGITEYEGKKYYYPFKYKNGYEQSVPNGFVSQYYIVFRLGDMYLIRAEARVKNGDLDGAKNDLNVIRQRAGIGSLELNSKDELINAILNERRKELFCEWGNRWFDLKRTGAIDSVMTNESATKGSSWMSFRQLFPISAVELNVNPLSTQNPGYH